MRRLYSGEGWFESSELRVSVEQPSDAGSDAAELRLDAMTTDYTDQAIASDPR